MNMKDIIEWRDTSRLSVKLDENDLIRIDGLINEVIRLERLNQKGKCFSCRFWKSSQESSGRVHRKVIVVIVRLGRDISRFKQ